MSRDTRPRQVIFDPTPEIFATDSAGAVTFPLLEGSQAFVDTSAYDEARFVFERHEDHLSATGALAHDHHAGYFDYSPRPLAS